MLDELGELDLALAPIAERLSNVLRRFDGYGTRFSVALARALDGEHSWIDGTDRAPCHRVWFQLHEDLIATLGLRRGDR